MKNLNETMSIDRLCRKVREPRCVYPAEGTQQTPTYFTGWSQRSIVCTLHEADKCGSATGQTQVKDLNETRSIGRIG